MGNNEDLYECVHCGQLVAPSENGFHWKECPKHPAGIAYAALEAELSDAQGHIEELTQALGEKVVSDAQIERMMLEDGRMDLTLRTDIAKLLAAWGMDLLSDGPGNFMEIGIRHSNGTLMNVTVQRVGGIMPMQRVQAMEKFVAAISEAMKPFVEYWTENHDLCATDGHVGLRKLERGSSPDLTLGDLCLLVETVQAGPVYPPTTPWTPPKAKTKKGGAS